MIQHGDFSRPARVQVQDGEKRDWWRPWRKRPTWRLIFVGYVQNVQHDIRHGTSLEMVDALSRMRYSEYAPFGVETPPPPPEPRVVKPPAKGF